MSDRAKRFVLYLESVQTKTYHAVHLVEELQCGHIASPVGLAEGDGAVEPVLVRRLIGPPDILCRDRDERV